MSTLDNFSEVTTRLEEAFQVRHITTTDLIKCSIDGTADDLIKQNPSIDQFPVEANGKIVGILETGKYSAGSSMKDCMTLIEPTDSQYVVSAFEPILQFIHLMGPRPEQTFYLVRRGLEIEGIVTYSDLHKLPVRLLAFALVAHLEAIMANIISFHYPDEESCFTILKDKNQLKKLQKLQNDQKKAKIDVSLLEVSGFADKKEVVSSIFGYKEGDTFDTDLKLIIRLRNKVDHVARYIHSKDNLALFLENIKLTQAWIETLSGKYQDMLAKAGSQERP